MEATLHELVQLLIKSIPTIVFFLFLIFYFEPDLLSPDGEYSGRAAQADGRFA